MNVSTPPPLSSNLIGKWEWTKTVDKSGEIITPQTAGYSKSISYGNSDKVNGNYLYLTERDEAPMVLKQNNDFGKAELLGDTLNITTQFENRYIEFFLIKNSDNIYPELITTDLVGDYSNGFGSARHYYKRVGVADKP